MIIYIDAVLDVNGSIVEAQYLDTSQPAALAMLTSLQADHTKIAKAGYAQLTSWPHAAAGKTRWQLVCDAVNAAPPASAEKLLGLTY